MLYICPTPIGNLEDITIRTLNILKSVDEIYCEDTRNTINLLNHFEIKKPLFSLFEHNEIEKSEDIIEKLNNNINIAYVSDAGMPGISDPGEILVSKAVENNIEFTVLPGASAFIVALVASGLNTKKFSFIGFLERNTLKMKKELLSVKDRNDSLIIYESPHRIEKTIGTIYEVLGNRKIVLAREISKKFEEYIRTDIETLIENFKNNEITVKGEMIIIVDGQKEKKEEMTDEEIKEQLINCIKDGFSKKDSVKIVSQKFDLKKNRVYKISQEL